MSGKIRSEEPALKYRILHFLNLTYNYTDTLQYAPTQNSKLTNNLI